MEREREIKYKLREYVKLTSHPADERHLGYGIPLW